MSFWKVQTLIISVHLCQWANNSLQCTAHTAITETSLVNSTILVDSTATDLSRTLSFTQHIETLYTANSSWESADSRPKVDINSTLKNKV